LFLFNVKLMPAEEEPATFERVDLAPHLSRMVRDVISRREGTTWYVMSMGAKKKSAVVVAKERMETVVNFAVDQRVTMKDLRTGFEMVGWQGYQRAAELWEDDGRSPMRMMGIGTPQKGIGGKTGMVDAVGIPRRSPRRWWSTTVEASEDSAPETTSPEKSPPWGGGIEPSTSCHLGRSHSTPGG
jgi:hypothetical protein